MDINEYCCPNGAGHVWVSDTDKRPDTFCHKCKASKKGWEASRTAYQDYWNQPPKADKSFDWGHQCNGDTCQGEHS